MDRAARRHIYALARRRQRDSPPHQPQALPQRFHRLTGAAPCAIDRRLRFAHIRSKRKACARSTDTNALRAQLRSTDELVRLRAPHRICPCGAGFSLFEQLSDELRRLQKDPSLNVHRMALHVEEDACTIELIETNLDRDAGAG